MGILPLKSDSEAEAIDRDVSAVGLISRIRKSVDDRADSALFSVPSDNWFL